jgi:hypothetical protein
MALGLVVAGGIVYGLLDEQLGTRTVYHLSSRTLQGRRASRLIGGKR